MSQYGQYTCLYLRFRVRKSGQLTLGLFVDALTKTGIPMISAISNSTDP